MWYNDVDEINKKSYHKTSKIRVLSVAKTIMQILWNKIYRIFYPEKDPRSIREQYGISDNITLKINTSDGWFIATCPELPGLVTEGRSYEELLENLNDAVLTYYDVPKRDSECILNELNLDTQEGHVLVRRKNNSYQRQLA